MASLDSLGSYTTSAIYYKVSEHNIPPGATGDISLSAATNTRTVTLRARQLDNGITLLYRNDPDPIIRIKHLVLAIFHIISIIPRTLAHTIDYGIKWFKGNATYYDSPIYMGGHMLSLLRWNLVGLLFPQMGRLHFGDEERRDHIIRLPQPSRFNLDTTYRGTIKSTSLGLRIDEYQYSAPCFQPISNTQCPYLGIALASYINFNYLGNFNTHTVGIALVATPITPPTWCDWICSIFCWMNPQAPR